MKKHIKLINGHNWMENGFYLKIIFPRSGDIILPFPQHFMKHKSHYFDFAIFP